jgi:hypothetical protein
VQADASSRVLGLVGLQELAIRESSWIASRYGVSSTLPCLPKFLRMRFFSVKEYAIGLLVDPARAPPRNERGPG